MPNNARSGLQAILQSLPLGSSDRPEQHGIALFGQRQRLLRERHANFIDGLPADVAVRKLELCPNLLPPPSAP